MNDDKAVIVTPAGRPARAGASRLCPKCRSDKRVNAAGFGPPVIVCGKCGHPFEGATE